MTQFAYTEKGLVDINCKRMYLSERTTSIYKIKTNHHETQRISWEFSFQRNFRSSVGCELQKDHLEPVFIPLFSQNINSLAIIISQMEIESEKKHSYLDEFKIIKTLGAGYHAQVKLAVDEQGNYLAIKKYKKQTASLEVLKHELGIMKQLDHENLVRLVCVRQNATYKKADETTYACFAIVLEYVGGGELFDFIAQTGKFSEIVARTYFHQMMNGLHYMHEKGFAHRDIKPENVLLSDLFVLKLADFGFSCVLKGRDGSGVLKTKLGTEGYMAPQIPTKKYEGKSVDIFAAGVILFIMFAGNPPFEKATLNDPYYKIIKQKKFEIFWKAHSRKRPVGFFTEAFKDLFARMVAYDPSQRPTIEQISKHPWVQDVVCSHAQIKEQFNQRQVKLNNVLQQRRQEQQKQKANKVTAVSNQGSVSRGDNDSETQFLQIYNKEVHVKRSLPLLQAQNKDDIVLNDSPIFSISLLKNFICKHEIPLAQVDEENQIIGDQTDKLTVTQVADDNNSKLNIVYVNSYEIEEEKFSEQAEVQIEMGANSKGQLVLRFTRIDGSLLYFKKIINQIRNACYTIPNKGEAI